MPPADTRQAYRPVPRDFVERWPDVGWSEAEIEWNAHARTIKRWLEECGMEAMQKARRERLAAIRALRSRSRRKRYVLGQTMTPIRHGVGSGEGNEAA